MKAPEHIEEIKRAIGRAQHFTQGYSPKWWDRFSAKRRAKSALAASISNSSIAIDVELSGIAPDYSVILHWILDMSRRVNHVCDSQKIETDRSTIYWLGEFLQRANCVVKFA